MGPSMPSVPPPGAQSYGVSPCPIQCFIPHTQPKQTQEWPIYLKNFILKILGQALEEKQNCSL